MALFVKFARPPVRGPNRLLVRYFSWDGHGTDLLSDSLAHNAGVPKLILHAHGSSGFDVSNIVKNMDRDDEQLLRSQGIVHMAGSIIALPSACYLWNVRHPDEISKNSLAPVQLHRPNLEYFFIGSAPTIPPSTIAWIKEELEAEKDGMVIESMDIANAMGTFNVLNGEDRMVGAALLLPPPNN